MPLNAALLKELQTEWNGFKKQYHSIKSQSSFAGIQMTVTQKFVDTCNSILLVFAYGVFQQVLKRMRDGGVFKCEKDDLGKLMEASRVKLNWRNYALVKEGKNARNAIAHEGKYIPRKKCWEYITFIENELMGWGIILEEKGGDPA